jgi:hypothetical protein
MNHAAINQINKPTVDLRDQPMAYTHLFNYRQDSFLGRILT